MGNVTTSTKNLSFGEALRLAEQGHMIQREGWNGKGQFVFMQIGNTVSKDFIPQLVSFPYSVKSFLATLNEDLVINSSLALFNAQGKMQPGWVPSQGDLFATDWQVVS